MAVIPSHDAVEQYFKLKDCFNQVFSAKRAPAFSQPVLRFL